MHSQRKTLFVDFCKVFDLTDHCILLNKFTITYWSLDFLNGRKQVVKIGDYSLFNINTVGAETGQGVVPDPNDFKLVINDLN